MHTPSRRKCILSVSEDVRKSVDKYWSLVDDPLFTMPFPDPFDFGDPTPIPVSWGGVEVPVDIHTSGESFVADTGGGGGSEGEGGGSGDGGGGGGGGVTKSSGGCGGGGGGGATIVPPNFSTSHTPPYKGGELMILWWLIFAAPAVLVAVRIKRRK